MKIIRSRRKTLALEISSDACLIVRAPRLMPVFLIKKFIKQKQNWIIKKQKLIRDRNEKIAKISIPKITKQEALKKITQRVKYYASLSGFKYNKIKITHAKKRWGSCSYQNNLNFTIRLALAPLPVINYVVVHELCHIKEKNHSRNFWQEVSKIIPNYKIHQQWLKDNSYLLK